MKRAITTVLVAASLTATPAGAWPKPKVRRYKIVTGDGGQSILYGEKIRVKGFCVEVVLNRRVDTIACGIKYITELPDETPAESAPEAAPDPRGVSPATAAGGR